MRQPEQRLTHNQAMLALTAFQQICALLQWVLIAAHVRTTHAHLVVDGLAHPMRAIGDLKAAATKVLRRNATNITRLYWARGGNARRLATVAALWNAIHYVVSGQGDPMAVYQR